MTQNESHGSDWTDIQNDAIVSAYYEMLFQELAGKPYVKAQYNRLIVAQTGRNRSSVEWKFRNISYVLQTIGDDWIRGYKPASRAQMNALIEAIDRFKSTKHQEHPYQEKPYLQEAKQIFIEQPPAQTDEEIKPRLKDLIRKFDPAKRDASNRTLGYEGEKLAFASEIANLIAGGRKDLANKVEMVSETNDAAGYDIRSFDLQGKERLLEVKTTRGYERTPFYLSENERRFSEERAEAFKLFRIYNFDREPKAFELTPPLEQFVRLQATNYRAHF